MGKVIDITGQRFNKLLVLEKTDKRTKERQIVWLCKCDCGNTIEIRTSGLKYTKSCGCLQKEIATRMKRTHGMVATRIYQIWHDMKQRCTNINDVGFLNYGGRGITICDRWLNSFENFWEDMKNGYQDDLEIDRIDNNKGYYKENCRWITRLEQMQNVRTNRLITFNGETKTRTQWARITGLTNDVIRSRIDKYGWSIERALALPRCLIKHRHVNCYSIVI